MIRKIFTKIALHQKVILLVLLAAAVVFPLLQPTQYVIRMATLSLVYVVLALGMNLIMGYMGQMSFGHAAFFGIGAYTSAILSTRFGMDCTVTFLAAILLSGLFGFLLGTPVLKLKGYYLTIVTLGFCEIVRMVMLNWVSLTGGPMGIKAIPTFMFFGIKFATTRSYYYIILTICVLVTLLIYRLVNSRYGLAILAIRDDDSAAEAMGVNIVRYKIVTFVISSMIAGLAGAFFAHYISYIDSTYFTSTASQNICVMVILGGLGSLPGTFLGAIVLTLLPELLRGLSEYRMLIYGVIMVVVVLFMPSGLMGKYNFRQLKESWLLKKHEQTERREKNG